MFFNLLKKVIFFFAGKLINNPVVVIIFHFITFYAKKSHGISFALRKDPNKEINEVNNNEISAIASQSNNTEDDGSVYREENDVKQYIKPGEFVQPCGTFEVISIEASKYTDYNTAMAIRIESKVPITEGDVKTALWMVSRNIPHLQFCLAKRRGHYWFKRMLKLEIDFEVSSKTAMEIQHEMLAAIYNLQTGPLWKAKLILSANKTEECKFTAELVLGILHTINDGVTQLNIVREFTYFMNQITNNKTLNPTFSPVIAPIDKSAEVVYSLGFLAKTLFSKLYLVLIKQFHKEASFYGSFPFPKTTEAKTKILIDDFSKCETDVIIRLCKNERISVNSLIITVTNLALLTVAQSRSKTPIGMKDILVTQCVNLRRHFKPQYNTVSGFHIALLDDKFKTSLSDVKDFFSIIRRNQCSSNIRIEKKEHLKVLPIFQSLGLLYPINNYLTSNGMENRRISHYVTSNMGNLKNFLPEEQEDDNIKVTHIVRDCAIQHAGTAFLLNFQTLSGKLMLSMDYYTNMMEEKIATETFRFLCLYIRAMIKNENQNADR